MTQTDIRITELMTRLTALERERATIMAEIETLQSAPSEQTPPIKVIRSEKAGDLVDRNSTIESKIALFRKLFRGRSDVFPIRWENRKTGRSGYAPACANKWQRGICEKPKVKCSACPNQAFLAVDDVSMERHLRGTHANGAPFVMGVYTKAELSDWLGDDDSIVSKAFSLFFLVATPLVGCVFLLWQHIAARIGGISIWLSASGSLLLAISCGYLALLLSRHWKSMAWQRRLS
jgi:hypothetical protein